MINRVILPPTLIIPEVPGHGAGWWVSAAIDVTTVIRLIATPFFCLLSPIIPFLFELGSFAQAGTSSKGCIENGCKKGANALDLLAVWLWSLVWLITGLPSLL